LRIPVTPSPFRNPAAKDAFCSEVYEKVKQHVPAVRNFRLLNDTIVHLSPRTKSKRYFVPQDLRAMIIDYFHDSALSAHLGVAETLHRISKVFYWPGFRPDVAKMSGSVVYVRGRSQLRIRKLAFIIVR
jgi:hypothetical protein